MTRITYLFRSGRRSRLARSGQVPTEFFYGYQQLVERGVDVAFFEDGDVGLGPPLPWPARMVNRLSRFTGGLPLGMVLSLAMAGGGRRLDAAGVVVATTNNMGLALALGRMLGLVRVPVTLLAMGILPSRLPLLKRFLVLPVLRHLRLVTISRGEQEILRCHLPDRPIDYVPFGVDSDFWTPAPDGTAGNGGYVLAIGNDGNRDWTTLVQAWTPDLPLLKIVTRLPLPSLPDNVEAVHGDWRSQVLSDEDVRALYRDARCVVVPVRETTQPAGQSVCLQAMACGRPVILSEVQGLWDRELMRHGESLLLVPPGDARALGDAVRRLLDDQELTGRLERAGRSVVERHLNVDRMAEALLLLVEDGHETI